MTAIFTSSRWVRVLFIVATAAAIAAGSEIIMRRARASSGDLPPIAQIPSFTMTDQRGRSVSDQSLRGETLVVDFFYASCTSSCPMLTGKMLDIQRKLAKREAETGRRLPVHLVSITLDPANDTPDVLAAYAERTGADERRWSFLSGRSDDLDRVVVRGFKSTFERADPAAGIGTIMHGEWFVLVDGRGALRGFYAANDDERMDAIVVDAERLAEGGA